MKRESNHVSRKLKNETINKLAGFVGFNGRSLENGQRSDFRDLFLLLIARY